MEFLRRIIRGKVMPDTAIGYDVLIGAVINQAVREKRCVESFNYKPRYFVGLVILYRPIVAQPRPRYGWLPTEVMLLVWRGKGGYSKMNRHDLHLANRK